MATVSGEISGQFYQPTRPLHAYDIENDSSKVAEATFSDQYFDAFSDFEEDPESEVGNMFAGSDDVGGDDRLKILREFLGELDEEAREMLAKLVSKVGKEVPVERLLQELRGMSVSDVFKKLHQKLNGVGGKGPVIVERGLDAGGLKLERFKVKTVNVIGSGAVKEEEEPK